MQLVVSAGLILTIVLWGVLAPASLGGFFDTLLAVITRDFGWLYLWVVLGLVVLEHAGLFVESGETRAAGRLGRDREKRARQHLEAEATVGIGLRTADVVFRSQHRFAVDVRLERADVAALDEVGIVEQVEESHGYAGYRFSTIVGDPGLLSVQKFDGLPDATAMYCRPPVA